MDCYWSVEANLINIWMIHMTMNVVKGLCFKSEKGWSLNHMSSCILFHYYLGYCRAVVGNFCTIKHFKVIKSMLIWFQFLHGSWCTGWWTVMMFWLFVHRSESALKFGWFFLFYAVSLIQSPYYLKCSECLYSGNLQTRKMIMLVWICLDVPM